MCGDLLTGFLPPQAKFRRMVEENKQLATRIDGDIQNAQEEVAAVRGELQDATRRLDEHLAAVAPSTDPPLDEPPLEQDDEQARRKDDDVQDIRPPASLPADTANGKPSTIIPRQNSIRM